MEIIICGIYQIVNNINQKRYIGYTENFIKREIKHRSALVNKSHKNEHLQNAWNLYGFWNFKFEMIQECSKELLCFYEDYWAKVLKVHDREFGYNIRPTDPNGKPGLSKETKLKIGNSNKGKTFSEEGLKNVIAANRKRYEDPEFRDKMIRQLPYHFGETFHVSKLKEVEVLEIINRLNNKERICDISRAMGIAKSNIKNIKYKLCWKHLSHLLNNEL